MIRLGNFFFFQIVVENYALETFFIIIVLFHIQNRWCVVDLLQNFSYKWRRKGHCVLCCFAVKGLKGQVLDSFKNTFTTFFPLPSTVFPYEAHQFFASVLLI